MRWLGSKGGNENILRHGAFPPVFLKIEKDYYMQKWLDEKLRTAIYNPREKSQVQKTHILYMLARTQQMFSYTGLPDTIPARIVELYLQMNGHLCFAKHNNDLYVYTGGLGGEPDVYYQPTLYTIANPAQQWSKNLVIGEECIVMRNDSLYLGLLPMYSRYAYHLTENELSLLVADINSRIIGLISAGDDRTLASAKQYISDIEQGKLGIIGENAFLDGVKAQPYSTNGSRGLLQDLTEYEQYLKASWYNEIGLDANYNMKRERLSQSEVELNGDALLPLVDDMLSCRKEALEQVNAMFGTNINVSYSSAWEDNQQQVDIVTELLKDKVETGGIDDAPEGEVNATDEATTVPTA